MITNDLKLEGGPPNFCHAVIKDVRPCHKNILQKKFTPSHQGGAQHHHHDEVGAGGHPAAPTSHWKLKFGLICWSINSLECMTWILMWNSKYLDILLIYFSKILFVFWSTCSLGPEPLLAKVIHFQDYKRYHKMILTHHTQGIWLWLIQIWRHISQQFGFWSASKSE